MLNETFLLTKELMDENPIFERLKCTPGREVTITQNKTRSGGITTNIVGGRPDDRQPKKP